MPGVHDLWLFVVSGLLLNIAPGPDSLLIMTRAATQGWRAGFVATWAIGTGVCVHVVAAALGLSALLATSATAFTVVKVAGAAYLVWVGIGMLRQQRTAATEAAGDPEPAPSGETAPAPPRYRAIYAQGFLTNVLNPKVALFFLAFVPQFISADAPSKALAFLFLGVIFNTNGMLWCHALALSAAFAGARLKPGARLARAMNRTMGALFVGLGLKLALATRA
jgi:threonine/homoserine/homoserine lactone efflux protein